MKNDAYEVGYKKPPIANRFQVGQSGNPTGRAKGRKKLKQLFLDELARTITVSEGGKKRKLSKEQVIVRQLVDGAARGELKNAKIVLEWLDSNFSESKVDAKEEMVELLRALADKLPG